MGTSRAEIRRSVARMLSDYHEATDVTGVGTATFVDPVNLARESGFFKGMQILFTNPLSPHVGTVATVTSSHGPTRTVSFEPPLATDTIVGETIEMYNFKGRGTTIAQYNASINDAISMARQQHALIPHVYTYPDAFSRTSPSITIPDDFVSFSGVETTERNGYLYAPVPASYHVDRLARTVRFTRGSDVDRLHGLTLTIRGYAMPALLNDDADETSIDLEWLYNEVKAQLLERMVASQNPVSTADRLYLQERQEAAGKRTLIIPRAVPNTVRLM
jgi:hypothetical protein